MEGEYLSGSRFLYKFGRYIALRKRFMKIIESGKLRIEISEVGAEMQSLKDMSSGRELLWQGDAAYWHGRSPVLFPAVGGLWNGVYRTENGCYKMPKHGFVRQTVWEVSARSESSVTFAHERTADEAALFPWPYRVEVEYGLQGRSVCVAFRVYNSGDGTMYFQMGGHPGFTLPDFDAQRPVSGYIRFEERPKYLLRATEQGCTEAVHYPVPSDADGLVPVCVETFANEALILPDHQISAATLLRKDGTPLVRVSSSAPVWLFWVPQGVHAPFVCFEPWYGLCDSIGFEGEVGCRPFINRLEADAVWHGGYEILVY